MGVVPGAIVVLLVEEEFSWIVDGPIDEVQGAARLGARNRRHFLQHRGHGLILAWLGIVLRGHYEHASLLYSVRVGPHPHARRSGARGLAILATAAGAISARGAPPPRTSLRRSRTRYGHPNAGAALGTPG